MGIRRLKLIGAVALAGGILATGLLATTTTISASGRTGNGTGAAKNSVQVRPAAQNGPAAPQNTVTGNCGDSFIYLQPTGQGTSQMTVMYGFDSTLGPVTAFSLSVNWVNWATGGSGNVPDNNTNFGQASYHPNTINVTTGTGLVTANLTGTVTLADGSTCTLAIPNDNTTVS